MFLLILVIFCKYQRFENTQFLRCLCMTTNVWSKLGVQQKHLVGERCYGTLHATCYMLHATCCTHPPPYHLCLTFQHCYVWATPFPPLALNVCIECNPSGDLLSIMRIKTKIPFFILQLGSCARKRFL